MTQYFIVFKHYLIEIIPALAIGLFISGLVHEFIPESWIRKGLGKKGIAPILSATICGTILPICCWGSLPVALTFYKKGAKLGPVLAFLVATPATSISALLVAYKLLGGFFTVYIFFAVILMGLVTGVIGNRINTSPKLREEDACPECAEAEDNCECGKKPVNRVVSVFKFAFVDTVKDIGPEMLLGIALAALVATVVPVGQLIRQYLAGGWGYVFSLIFGLVMYICSTATVPLVEAFIKQGMNIGAGMVLLLAGPVTSYGTVLVLRKKFGIKILLFYLTIISVMSLVLGYMFYLIMSLK